MNRGVDSVQSVYSDARAEYTKQLCIFLVPAYFQFFIDLLERSKQEMSQEPKRALWQFQTHLNDIHEWNMERVSNEIQKIHTNSGCDYLEDLLTAVFIAHTKVLTAIRLGHNQKKIEINIPKVEHFLFKALCETAKLLWSSTYLFREGISSIEKQQNYRAIEGMLNEGILQAVRTLVPVKSILKDFVNQDTTKGLQQEQSRNDDDDDSDDDTVTSPVLSSAPPVLPSAPVMTDSTIDPLMPLEPLPEQNPIMESSPVLPIPVSTSQPQVIILDDKPSVRFGQFDAVFDSDHPTDSEMIYDPKESDTDEIPDLEIMDDNGSPLGDGDFDTMDNSMPCPIDTDDYEEL